MKRTAADLAIQIAEKLLGEQLDDQAPQKDLAEQYMSDSLARQPAPGGPSRRSRQERQSSWHSQSASSDCPTWASPRSSTPCPPRARRRRTTRSAPSSRTSAWCRCRTSGWTSSSALVKPQKTIPTSLEFVDIAGLVRGASKGEGLGNQFLANIRQVDAVLHVLRCFEDAERHPRRGRRGPAARPGHRRHRAVPQGPGDGGEAPRAGAEERQGAAARRETRRRPSWRCWTG